MSFEKSNVINFGHQNCHLRNQTRQILEIKTVIWEIKRVKFWKSKLSFEKSNASNFRNQKSNWEIKREKLWKWKVLFEKSNATNLKSKWQWKPKAYFLLIVDKISKSKKTRKESDIANFICGFVPFLIYSAETNRYTLCAWVFLLRCV